MVREERENPRVGAVIGILALMGAAFAFGAVRTLIGTTMALQDPAIVAQLRREGTIADELDPPWMGYTLANPSPKFAALAAEVEREYLAKGFAPERAR